MNNNTVLKASSGQYSVTSVNCLVNYKEKQRKICKTNEWVANKVPCDNRTWMW